MGKWVVAQVSIVEEKIHVLEILTDVSDVLDGIEWIYGNQRYLKNGGLLAMVKNTGHIRIYRKSVINERPEAFIVQYVDIQETFDNSDILIPYFKEGEYR